MVVNPFRRQLPVYSPLPASSIAAALLAALRPGQRPRQRLMQILAERFAADHVVLYGSGTQALTVAIRLALQRAAPGDVVALPGFSCYDVASAAVGAGCRILLYDLDPDTLAPDWTSLEDAFRSGARAAVLAPLYGYAYDWSVAEEIAARHGAVLVEDAAQAAGGRWTGRLVGSFGRLSVLSFGRGKGWTGGGGGALLLRGGWDGEVPAEPAAGFGLGVLPSVLGQLLLGRPAVYGLPYSIRWLHLGETRYREPRAEHGISRLSAALVAASAAAATAEAAVRKQNAAELGRKLDGVAGLRAIRRAEPAEPGALRLPCRLDGPGQPPTTIQRLGRLGVERSYPGTLAELQPVRHRLAGGASPHIPGAELLARELVTLPTHSRGSSAERAKLVRELVDSCAQHQTR